MKFSPEGHAGSHKHPSPEGEQPHVFNVSDNRVQMELMKMVADPARENPYEAWFSEVEGKSFAARYREYAESPQHTGEQVDISHPEDLEALMSNLKPTLH